jgi:hypothetical protein
MVYRTFVATQAACDQHCQCVMYDHLSTPPPSLPIDLLRQLFSESPSRGGAGFGGCDLQGISLGGGRYLANLGSILIDGIAIIALFLIWRSNRKRAAVGRRYLDLLLCHCQHKLTILPGKCNCSFSASSSSQSAKSSLLAGSPLMAPCDG